MSTGGLFDAGDLILGYGFYKTIHRALCRYCCCSTAAGTGSSSAECRFSTVVCLHIDHVILDGGSFALTVLPALVDAQEPVNVSSTRRVYRRVSPSRSGTFNSSQLVAVDISRRHFGLHATRFNEISSSPASSRLDELKYSSA